MTPSPSRAQIAVLLIACSLLAACHPATGARDPAPQSSAALPVQDPDLTTCRDVLPPPGGFGEGDFGTEASPGAVATHNTDTRNGQYRNVEYVIAYRDDPSCRTTPGVARLLDRLDPPGW